MRISTPGFAHSIRQAAMRERVFAAFGPDDLSGDRQRALKAHTAALMQTLTYPVTTPAEIVEKLRLIRRHDVLGWGDDGTGTALDALDDDLQAQVTYTVSADMEIALREFRSAYELIEITPGSAPEPIAERHTASIYSVFAVPCTTPGDFIAKSYIGLLTSIGGTNCGPARDDLSGNMFDPNIAWVDDRRTLDDASQIATYRDLDATDLGANLLAYGLPTFSAECWMERADAVGLQVRLMCQGDAKGLWYGTGSGDEPVERISSERDRLIRLIGVDRARRAAVAAQIEEEWPQLICVVPALPEEKAA